MWHKSLLVLVVASQALSVFAAEQQLLQNDASKKTDLMYELKKAEIIPTVLDTFSPTVALSIFWENATAELGNTVVPAKVQSAPAIEFLSLTSSATHTKHREYTLALTDPDAPSRDNPEWSQICHWIATGIPLIDPNNEAASMNVDAKGIKEIMPYKPPGPPPKTGKHRYVFVALTPKNGTSERLHLSKPGDRQHWGYEKERQGLRMWAEENGLEVVGANFIYSQNDEQ